MLTRYDQVQAGGCSVMANEQWWRSWHGAPTDPKWLVVAEQAHVNPGMVAAVAWALLDHASQQADRGNVSEFDVETISTFYH